MKCISLHQPWASLVVIGAKKFETRGWPTSYRGTLLIHAAKKWNRDLQATCFSDPFEGELYDAGYISSDGLGGKSSWKNPLPFGCILGTVEVVECHAIRRIQAVEGISDSGGIDMTSSFGRVSSVPTGDEFAFGDFAPGRYAWQLAKPRRFAKPVPFCGHQGFFNVPAEVVADQMKAVAA